MLERHEARTVAWIPRTPACISSNCDIDWLKGKFSATRVSRISLLWSFLDIGSKIFTSGATVALRLAALVALVLPRAPPNPPWGCCWE